MSRSTSPSLRTVLVGTTVLHVGLAVTLTGVLAHRSGQRAVTLTATELQQEISESLEQEILHTLDAAHLVGRLNRDALAAGLLDAHDDQALVQTFLHQLQAFPVTSFIQLGRADGSFVGVERTADGFSAEVTLPDGAGKGVFPLDAAGLPSPTPLSVVQGYDATRRPWFRAAIAAGRPTWSGIYQFSSQEAVRLGVTAVEQVDLPDGTRGVVGTDLVLSRLSAFLQSLRLPPDSQLFVMDREGLLVASSSMVEPFQVVEGQAQRVPAAAVSEPWTAASAQGLSDVLAELAGPTRIDVSVRGRHGWVRASPVGDDRGIDWVVAVVLPEAAFMREISHANRRTGLIILAALVTSTLLGGALAQWISSPLARMVAAAEALAEGDWERPIPDGSTAELQRLAGAFATMRRQLQGMLVQRTEAMEAAQEADRAKSAFLANMSHELRTPMNAILGYTELMLEDSDDGGQKRDLARVHTSGTHLRHLIDQMLDLARVEAGTLTLNPTDVDVPDVVQQVADTIQPLLAARANTLQIDLGRQPLVLHTDAGQLRQCLLNLVGNAAKFTENGTIRIVVRPQDGGVTIDVVDTGPGIEPELLPHLFEPFVRAGLEEGPLGSTGLGLAITRSIAEALGGTVTVTSELGSGSTFRLALRSIR